MPEPPNPLELLWSEYSRVFKEFDDLTLARWMAQTLGQFQGYAWRASHPLIGAYRLAAHVAHDRQIWLKRLVNAPADYQESGCCRAPFVPLLTRDVIESGLLCQHCGATIVPFDEIPEEAKVAVQQWATEYAPIHAVAHWDDRQRKSAGDYDRAYENAAEEAERLLSFAGKEVIPKLLDCYRVIVWEDQDDCLEVRPEDIAL